MTTNRRIMVSTIGAATLAGLAAACVAPHLAPPVPPAPPTASAPVLSTFDVVACQERADPCTPIAGATVEIQTAAGWQSQHANGDGYTLWTVENLPRSALRITADGYEPILESITPPTMGAPGQHNRYGLVPVIPPLVGRDHFAREYQGNFGSIAVDQCWTYGGTLFDPVDLLVNWETDHACFEKLMQQHADRGDNRVVLDPRADYRGEGGILDYWHDPATVRAFLLDVRKHRNKYGEPFGVLLFFSGDGHVDTFLAGGQGQPSATAEAHFANDVHALAAATRDLIDGTAVCWECRHQRDYMTPGTFARLAAIIAREFPDAWHGVHLSQGSSSVSSWNCGDASDPACNAEGDDPFQGSEPGFWDACRAAGYCDGLLYQFNAGDPYLNPHAYPNYTGHDGALGRWWEIVIRTGNDPTSIATLAREGGNNRRGWRQFDLVAFEHIYDAYNGRSTEAYGIDWCRQALAIGGWGCGSASYRQADAVTASSRRSRFQERHNR